MKRQTVISGAASAHENPSLPSMAGSGSCRNVTAVLVGLYECLAKYRAGQLT